MAQNEEEAEEDADANDGSEEYGVVVVEDEDSTFIVGIETEMPCY